MTIRQGDKKVRRPWYSGLFLLLGGAGVVSTAASVGLGYIATDRGWLILTASGIVLAASQLDRVTEFSIAGATAKLQQKIDEANETIDHIRSVAVALAKPTMILSMRAGRWGSGLSRRETYELKNEVERTLEQIGVSPEDINDATEEFRLYTKFDLAHPVFEIVKKALDAKVADFEKKTAEFGPTIKDIEGYRRASEVLQGADEQRRAILQLRDLNRMERLPAELELALRRCPLFTPEEVDALMKEIAVPVERLRHFEESQEIIDLENWCSSDAREQSRRRA